MSSCFVCDFNGGQPLPPHWLNVGLSECRFFSSLHYDGATNIAWRNLAKLSSQLYERYRNRVERESKIWPEYLYKDGKSRRSSHS